MRFRAPLVAVIASLAIAATAPAALAHEEINPKTFPTGQPTFLTVTAANEASADLVKIVLRAPADLGFGEATRSPAGWSAAAAEDTITWTGGAVKHDNFESFGFEIEGADQPGTLTYKVTLGYAGGKTEDHEVDVTATAPGAGAAAPATTVTTGATVTSASPTTAAAAPAESRSGSDGDSGTAKAALAVSIVALLVAAGALAVGARRSGGNRAPGGGAAPGAAQDW